MVIFICVENAYVLYNLLNAIDFVNCKKNIRPVADQFHKEEAN